MIEFLMEYALFIAEVLTIGAAVVLVIAFTVALTTKEKEKKHKLRIKRLNKRYRKFSYTLHEEILERADFKAFKKEMKKKKESEKKDHDRRRIFVINFQGDVRASGTASFAEIITAILTTATPEDEVVVRLESAGGIVHAYGLAASQLKRIRERNIPLVVTIDRMAASGGYMMACVANRIIAAPFALVGSVGVIAQLPNFNGLLKKKNITYEQIMAGEYKRTISMFGENTSKDRAKCQDDVDNIHTLFKEFVTENRPQVDIAKIATGETWHGVQAIELKLVDQLMTSDDYLLTASEHANIFEIGITGKKPVMQRLTQNISSVLQDVASYYTYYQQ